MKRRQEPPREPGQGHVVTVAIITTAGLIAIAIVQHIWAPWWQARTSTPPQTTTIVDGTQADSRKSQPPRSAAAPGYLTKSERTQPAAFAILSPQPDSQVEATEQVLASTPDSANKHFIVVTPMKIGGQGIVQSYPMHYANGMVTGVAVFGSAGAGQEQAFEIRIISTTRDLPEGELHVPPDANWSNAVVVWRKATN